MPEDQPMTECTIDGLLPAVKAYHEKGYRLVQISCTKVDENFELSYCFDIDCHMVVLRLVVPAGTQVPSISGIYWGAFIYENEAHDFFGVEFTGINIDFKGTLLRTAKKYPFSNISFREVESCQKK